MQEKRGLYNIMSSMQYAKISTVKKNPNNPRIIKDKQYKKLKESLSGAKGKEFFEARPCIVSNRTGENIIIAGNTRYQAAKDLKWLEVPVAVMEGLTEEQEQEIIIRDNVTNGEWDFEILANEWDAVKLEEWGVLLPITLDEPSADELDAEKKDKPFTMKLTFATLEDMENAQVEIEKVILPYVGAYISVSGGEL